MAGTANTGGGGGAGAALDNGHNGGSGIVIISAAVGTITATGGTHTVAAGHDIWTFTSSGTWTPFLAPLASLTLTTGASAVSSSTPTPTQTPLFDKAALSIDDPASLWVVVNKRRPLPMSYEPNLVVVPVGPNPPQLRPEASAPLVEMFAQFYADTGKQMQSKSAFRSYSDQVNAYKRWVDQLGQEEADRQSARPGYSEHQTGLAIDIVDSPASDCGLMLLPCFAVTEQAKWLATNAFRWGFVLRYPADKISVTGYKFEPWHYRYVGVALATEMHNTGITTLEEFFGLPAAPTYAG